MSEDQAMVIFQPSGRRGDVPKGVSVIEASRILGVDIETLCGEKKVCGKCIVRIEDGHFDKYGIRSRPSHVSPWQEEEGKFIDPEHRGKGFRLGCAARMTSWFMFRKPPEPKSRLSAKPHGIFLSSTTRPSGCIMSKSIHLHLKIPPAISNESAASSNGNAGLTIFQSTSLPCGNCPRRCVTGIGR